MTKGDNQLTNTDTTQMSTNSEYIMNKTAVAVNSPKQ